MASFATSRLALLTDRRQTRRPLPETVAAAIDGGARLVVLREKDLPVSDRRALAERMSALLAPVGGQLIIAGSSRIGVPAAVGLHLSSTDPWPARRDQVSPRRDPAGPRHDQTASHRDQAGLEGGGHDIVPSDHLLGSVGPIGLVGRSCHSVADVVTAAARGADYATLSPIFPSRSKPGYGPPLGPAVFAAVPAEASTRVYALGGIDDPRLAEACVTAGAFGVAVMGAVMRATDPAVVVAALLDAVGEKEKR